MRVYLRNGDRILFNLNGQRVLGEVESIDGKGFSCDSCDLPRTDCSRCFLTYRVKSDDSSFILFQQDVDNGSVEKINS